MRQYQVLPKRTHPTMQMHGASGFLLSATKLAIREHMMLGHAPTAGSASAAMVVDDAADAVASAQPADTDVVAPASEGAAEPGSAPHVKRQCTEEEQ